MSQDPAFKLRSRIAEWQSCVGAPEHDRSVATPAEPALVPTETPAVELLPPEVGGALAIAEPPGRQPGEEGEAGPASWSPVDELRRSVDHERARARHLADTLTREQALHAATLMLQAQRVTPPARPPVPPSRQDLEIAVTALAARRLSQERARKRQARLAVLLLLLAAVGGLLILVRLW